MKLKISNTLITGAIAALIAGPLWATSDTAKDGAFPAPPTRAATGQSTLGDPMNVNRTQETSRLGAPVQDGASATTRYADNPLFSRSADDLDGVEVIDRLGDEVGDIKQILLDPNRSSAHAVISVGGFLGMGASDVMISLDDLKPVGDKLQMSATKQEVIDQKDDALDTDQYVELTGTQPISGSLVEFSAFEPGNDSSLHGPALTTPRMGSDSPASAPETPQAPR